MALPSGYRRVEYIESSGTQYIDTGFKPNQDTRVVFDFEITSLSSDYAAVFGARSGLNVNAFDVFANKTDAVFRSDYLNDQKTVAATMIGRHTIDKNKNVFTCDGITVTNPTAAFSSGYPIYLGNINTAGVPYEQGIIGNIYTCQIYDNGTIVREYIPCINASGAVGLYDIVNDEFYGNAGSGEFTAGAVVNSFDIPGYENVDGILKALYDGYENVEGILKKILYGYQNVGGSLVPLQYEPVVTCTVTIKYRPNRSGEMTIDYQGVNGATSYVWDVADIDELVTTVFTQTIECVKGTYVYMTYVSSSNPTVTGDGSFVSSTSLGNGIRKITISVNGDCIITAEGAYV